MCNKCKFEFQVILKNATREQHFLCKEGCYSYVIWLPNIDKA